MAFLRAMSGSSRHRLNTYRHKLFDINVKVMSSIKAEVFTVTGTPVHVALPECNLLFLLLDVINALVRS